MRKDLAKRFWWFLFALNIQYWLTAICMQKVHWVPYYLKTAPHMGLFWLLTITLLGNVLVQCLVTATLKHNNP